MTLKEITALRKSGRLDDAMKAAEELFDTAPDKFSASAVFWCLNDKLKQSSSAEDVHAISERMERIYSSYGQGDQYMVNAMTNLSRRVDPLYSELKVGLEKAKRGEDVSELYETLVARFNENTLLDSHYSDFGWLIYYILRSTPLNDAQTRKVALHQYLKLNLPRPSMLHSLILGEAVKVEDNTPFQFHIRNFMNLWGWENLRNPEDWEQFKTDDGKIVTSLVEKLIKVYSKELKTDGIPSPKEFSDLIDKATAQFPNNQYMPLYKAYELLSLGKKDEALDNYKKLILRSPAKSYLWSQLSDLIDDLELKTALLCKAITVEKDEQFVGKARLKLVSVLTERNLLSLAACELTKYKEFYTSKGWGLKEDYWQVANLIDNSTVEENSDEMFAEALPKAEQFLYSSLPSELAVKITDKVLDDKNRPGRKYTQWTLKTKNGIVRIKNPRKWGLNNKLKNGTLLDIKTNEGKVVWVKESKLEKLDFEWIKTLIGEIKLRTDRNGNPYAIFNGVYIGAKLLDRIAEGQKVVITALKQNDGRWSAISLKNIP